MPKIERLLERENRQDKKNVDKKKKRAETIAKLPEPSTLELSIAPLIAEGFTPRDIVLAVVKIAVDRHKTIPAIIKATGLKMSTVYEYVGYRLADVNPQLIEHVQTLGEVNVIELRNACKIAVRRREINTQKNS